MSTEKFEKRLKRRKRIRSKVVGTGTRPRLSVFRSNDHIYAQIINDEEGITLMAASDKELLTNSKNKNAKSQDKQKLSKKDLSFAVGELLAQKSAKKKIKRVVFDRGGFKYHGRVEALAAGAKKGGLEF